MSGAAGSVGGQGGMSGAAGGAGGAEAIASSCLRGEVSGDEVVVLGDVFIAQDHAVTASLEALAREAGALSSSETYRDYSSTIENSLSIGNALLLDRYVAAQAESPVKVVIMNGGGSDLLLGSCEGTPTADCPLMIDVVAGAEQLLSRMAADAVEHVVWFFYPDPTDAELLEELDVLRPLLRDECESSSVPCHWLDLRPTFDGHYSEYMQTDFVPTEIGAQAAADAIWLNMEQNCIGQ